MADTHSRKSHDYASNDNPYGNYHFAGLVANLFSHSHEDAGFVGRIGEKIYRLANLEKDGKTAKNESISDTEIDIVTIAALWMADRRQRRLYQNQIEYRRFVGESMDIRDAFLRMANQLTPGDLIVVNEFVRSLMARGHGISEKG